MKLDFNLSGGIGSVITKRNALGLCPPQGRGRRQ
jgi:hypothetical protein